MEATLSLVWEDIVVGKECDCYAADGPYVDCFGVSAVILQEVSGCADEFAK